MPVFALPAHGKLVRAGRKRREIECCLQRRTPVAKRRQSGRRRSWPSFSIEHLNFVRTWAETGRQSDSDVQTASRQRKRLTLAFRLFPARDVFSQIEIDAERPGRRLFRSNLVDWLDFTSVLRWWRGIFESERGEPKDAGDEGDSRSDCGPFQPAGKLISHTVSKSDQELMSPF